MRGVHLSGDDNPIHVDLEFPTPTYAGEEVTVRVEARAIQAKEAAIELTTSVIRPGSEIGCEGRAVVHPSPSDGWPHTPGMKAKPSPAGEATTFKNLRLRQRAIVRRTFTENDVRAYIRLTGDNNPLYTDAAIARGMGLEAPPVPAALLGGLISCLLGFSTNKNQGRSTSINRC